MSQNPLQKYFRQPKIYIKLPSKAVFYDTNMVIQGDVNRIPVFGMTGMDEIIARTPDALLTGESTVKIIESCIPNIIDAWKLNLLDLEIVLTAVRIATYGQKIDVTTICNNCAAENSYNLDLSARIEFYHTCIFDNKVSLEQDLVVYLKPLTYKLSSDYGLQNFQMQQQLKQIIELTDEEQRQKLITEIYQKVGDLQRSIILNSIDYIETSDVKVTEEKFISEWLENCDKSVFSILQEKIEANRKTWEYPSPTVKCGECSHEQEVILDLDRSSFFVNA